MKVQKTWRTFEVERNKLWKKECNVLQYVDKPVTERKKPKTCFDLAHFVEVHASEQSLATLNPKENSGTGSDLAHSAARHNF